MARAIGAQPYLSLDAYRQQMNIPMCAFNGVENPDESISGCDHYWTQWEREMVAQALEDAEETLANHLHYWIGPRYLTAYDVPWTDPAQLPYGHVIGGGIRGRTEVTPTASDFTIDPATITVTASDFPGGTGEIVVIETATGLEIVPDKIETSGVSYIIYIDQCKLIEWDDLENQADPILYDNTFPATTWLKLADLTVYREYLDDSDQATIAFVRSCDCWICAGAACTGDEYSGCVYVLDEQIGKVRVALATYDATAGTWSCTYPTLYGCYHGSKMKVNYQAGTINTPGWQRAIRSLAHTYMVLEPCGCALFDVVLNRDRRIPETLTAERINCQFGSMDGAWYAWNWTRANQHGKAFMLG